MSSNFRFISLFHFPFSLLTPVAVYLSVEVFGPCFFCNLVLYFSVLFGNAVSSFRFAMCVILSERFLKKDTVSKSIKPMKDGSCFILLCMGRSPRKLLLAGLLRSLTPCLCVSFYPFMCSPCALVIMYSNYYSLTRMVIYSMSEK